MIVSKSHNSPFLGLELPGQDRCDDRGRAGWYTNGKGRNMTLNARRLDSRRRARVPGHSLRRAGLSGDAGRQKKFRRVNDRGYGEVVFNTSLTGYQEILTDPSYYGQIVCMTEPSHRQHRREHRRPRKPALPGARASSSRSLRSRPPTGAPKGGAGCTILQNMAIPGLYGVDTRALTRHLRTSGVDPRRDPPARRSAHAAASFSPSCRASKAAT